MTFAARLTSKPTIEKRRTCSKCGRLGHLVTTCTNPDKYHDMIGIEIEGWWNDLIAAQRKASDICGSQGRRDGSIVEISTCVGRDEDDAGEDLDDPDTADCEEGCDDCPHPIERRNAPRCSKNKPNCKVCGARGWEFQTRPGSVGESLRQLTQLYPDVTSRSAGMHVHMSFREPTSISMLCSEAFFTYWQERWEKWGTKNNVQGAFWERLRNENNYCRPTTMEDYKTNNPHPKGANLVTANAGGRYRAINFQSFDEHKTVEFRLLPMFQKGNLAVSAVEQLVDIVESFLQNHKLDTDIIATPIKRPASADEPVTMEPVNLDFDIPVHEYPTVYAEVDLDKPFKPGLGDDGVMRMHRYQMDTYLANLANSAVEKKAAIADPKRSKVVWETFNPTPTGNVR